MRNYLKGMKHILGFTAILAVLLFGMTFVVAANAAVLPAGDNVKAGVAAVVPPRVPPEVPPIVLGANRSDAGVAFNRAAFNPFFNRAAFNPFFVRPAFNPFFVRPVFNPFFGFDEEAFGADFD